MNVIQIRVVNDATGMCVEDLVSTQAFLQLVAKQITENGHEVSEHITESLALVTRELDERLRADLLREEKLLLTELEGYKSIGEKKRNREARLSAVRQRLGTDKPETNKQKR